MGRSDKIKQILRLAKNMRDSFQGYSIEMIQDEFYDFDKDKRISRRTAMRIKNIIGEVFEMEEVPQYNTKIKKWRLKKGTLDSITAFTTDEIATLENCQAYMKSQNYTNRCDLLPDIIQKMKITTSDGVKKDVDALLEYQGYAVHQAPKIKLDKDTLEKISQALLAQKYLTFWYTNKKGEKKFRKVAPYAVIYGEYTYLVAKGDDDEFYKHFLLYKMQNTRVADDDYFDRDETFNLEEHLAKSFGVYQDLVPMKVKLLFSAKVRDIVENYSLHPNQQLKLNDDGTTTVTFEAGGENEICWYLFRWGEDVKILEPQSLKNTYKELIEKAQKQIL